MTHAHPLTCQELLASISEYVDGSLNPELCQEIERHLLGCENCRAVVDTTTKVLYLYRQAAEKISLPGEVQERLMSALDLSEFFNKPVTFEWEMHPKEAVQTPPKTPPVQCGAPCPQCGQGILDYNGMLELECPRCGFSTSAGAGCT